MLSFLLMTFLFVIGSFSLCEGACAGANSIGPLPEFLPFCRWYSRSSCCTSWALVESTRMEIEAIESHYADGNNSCGSGSPKCASAVALIACGFRCSPETKNFVSDDLQTATICPAMAQRLYDSCKEFYDGSPDSCTRIGDTFQTAEKFEIGRAHV